MARVFISHSSKDKAFARQLAHDLSELGHTPWLDELEIRVGDCIVTGIEKGLSECEYVVVVMSEHSVASGWVEREWKAKYWAEVESGEVAVLPVLISDCSIPTLLKTRRYADFRSSAQVGMVHLMSAFSPVIGNPQGASSAQLTVDDELAGLIELTQSKSIPLSQCVAKTLSYAKQIGNGPLEYFCKNELVGWEAEARKKRPLHRVIQAYASMYELNMQFVGWGSTAGAMAYVKNNPKEFTPTKLVLPHAIADLETEVPKDPSTKIMSVRGTLGTFFPTADNPDIPIFIYAPGNVFSQTIEMTRREMTRLLIELLPGG